MSKDTKAILKRRAELIDELTEFRTGVRAGRLFFEPPQPCLSPASTLVPQICLSPVGTS